MSNLAVPLLSTVDTAMMGHLDSELYLAGLALGAAVLNFLYWGLGFLRMGTTGLTAQACGAKNTEDSAAILMRGLIVALGISFLLIVLQKPIEWVALGYMEGSELAKGLAGDYFYILIYAAPPTLCLMVVHGWFLGMQNARFPLILTLFVNLLNLGLNLFFLYQMGMKLEGIALGTLLAQYAGLIFALGLLAVFYKPYLKAFKFRNALKSTEINRFFKVNGDVFIRTVFLILTLSYLVAVSGHFGDRIIEVNAILMLMFTLMSYGIDGMAFAAESLVGRFVGENDPVQLRKAVRLIFAWSMGLAASYSLLYLVAPAWIIGLLTDKTAVIEATLEYKYWIALLPIVATIAFIWDGVYLGATQTRPLRNSMALATLMVFFPVWFLTRESWGNHGLWFALILFMAFRGISLSILAKNRIFQPGKTN